MTGEAPPQRSRRIRRKRQERNGYLIKILRAEYLHTPNGVPVSIHEFVRGCMVHNPYIEV